MKHLIELVTDFLIIGMGLAFLYHFITIWIYGRVSIGEPNTLILTSETVLFIAIVAFGIIKVIVYCRRH